LVTAAQDVALHAFGKIQTQTQDIRGHKFALRAASGPSIFVSVASLPHFLKNW
jgi:hypothetical protein